MPMKRLFGVWPYLLLLCAGLGLNATGLAQTASDPLLGTWSGQMRYGNESMQLSVRFKSGEKNSTVMLFDVPEMNLHNVGAFPVKQQNNDEYKTYVFTFRLARWWW